MSDDTPGPIQTSVRDAVSSLVSGNAPAAPPDEASPPPSVPPRRRRPKDAA